ncbi:MAG TPA: hypothetical protein VIX86_27915 [Streptosporangiaceae bacterium]
MGTMVRSWRVATAAAVALGLLTLVNALGSVPLDGLVHRQFGGPAVDWLTSAAIAVPVAVVGTLVAARRPGNPIGWMLLVIFNLVGAPAADYVILDYRMHHGTLPLGMVAVGLLEVWPIWLVLIVILLWLFPDGRLPAGRWRRVSVVLVTAGTLVALAVSAGLIVAAAGPVIPVDASGNLTAHPAGAWEVPQRVLTVMLLVSLVAGFLTWLAVQVPTYRRSSGERRQQLKWLYGGAVVFVAGVFMPSSPAVFNFLGGLLAAALPVCIGVAVLKYHLYAIDRIISRVISYAIITAVLAGIFAGLVVLATGVLPFKTPVAVAVSTLAVAALFNPLRKRVQRAVDRRFNRARYNAEAVVADFTTRLRQTVDLGTVQGDLVGVVREAFQPAHVSLWLMAGTAAEPLRSRH